MMGMEKARKKFRPAPRVVNGWVPGARRLLLVPVVAVALTVTGCSSDQPRDDYAAMCVNAQGVRVDDSQCGRGGSDNGSDFIWWYLLASHAMPPVGYGVAPYGAVRTVPRGHVARAGVPRTGFTPRPGATVAPRATRTVSTPKPKASSSSSRPKVSSSSKPRSTSRWRSGSSGGGYKAPTRRR